MVKFIFQFLVVFLAIGVGLYPITYFIVERTFGLLGTKTDELLNSLHYNIAFYSHILLSGIALLIGWTQFSKRFRNRYLHLHRLIGKIYVTCAMIGGTAGFYLAWFATGGWISMIGFVCLAILWLSTTWIAYQSIKRKDENRHQVMMIFSYSICFAAVTLRLWLPLMNWAGLDFITGYRMVAWLCWMPNLVFAFVYTRSLRMV